ncbi:MAG: lipopolysaccharide kinase InaA family protein [Planctomycetota bacterium]
MSAPRADDAAVLDGWWREVQATGALPREAALVQGRLVRQVGRATLPSGPVFVKVMAFVRGKDRLRYLLRPLPGAHEAAMLRAVAAAGVPCPEVVAVRTARRGPVPFRSMLVLRALDVATPTGAVPDAVSQLADRAALAARLLAAGLLHPDLNADNFVPLADGRLAVLDLQSMRPVRDRAAAGRRMAARLLLEAADVEPDRALGLLAAAGLCSADDGRVAAAAAAEAHAWLRQRVLRCLGTSTGFERRGTAWTVVEHRRRGELPPGRWRAGGAELLDCWLGQRLLEVCEARPPRLPALRRAPRWRARRQAVYIPRTMSDAEAERELDALRQARRRLGAVLDRAARPALAQLQRWRRPELAQ